QRPLCWPSSLASHLSADWTSRAWTASLCLEFSSARKSTDSRSGQLCLVWRSWTCPICATCLTSPSVDSPAAPHAFAGSRWLAALSPSSRGCPVGDENSSALLSLRNLRRLLTEQKSTLVALDLSRTSITPESLRTIAQVPDLVLKELCFHGCKELTDYSVEALVKHQPSLQRLDISACTDLTSRSVVAIAWGLKSLTHLSVSHDWRITEKGLAELLSVPSLRSLDLSECVHVNGTEIVKGLMGSNASRAQLKIINLRSCNYIRDLSVFSLAQLLGDTLCELDLTSCISVTDLSVRAIATYLQRLVVLRLGWCKQVTDWGLLGMVEMTMCEPDKDRGDKDSRFTRTFGNMGFFKPPCLPFEARPKLVTETDLEQFKQQAGASLLALSRLQELDLSSCSRLTDSSITQVGG
uniref:Leucine rich repeat containing 29 n=1 Tax=Monopterus albus TaxID=43700 RepID=A0A3Q3IWH9_MONAL